MPTKERLNISIVDKEVIDRLYSLRNELENELPKGSRISLADVVKALLKSKNEDNGVISLYL